MLFQVGDSVVIRKLDKGDPIQASLFSAGYREGDRASVLEMVDANVVRITVADDHDTPYIDLPVGCLMSDSDRGASPRELAPH